MNLNPEFQRQLQLEFSQARLIGIPLTLSVIFALTYLSDDKQFAEDTARAAIGLFLLIVSFWGARQSVDSVLDEQRAHTWDTQRLSALDPLTMVLGKLFGSTLVVWYGGAICLAVYAIAASSFLNFVWVASFAIISGLFIQSLSLMMSLVGLRKDYMSSNSMIIGFALLAAFFSAVWIMPLAEPKAIDSETMVTWYDMKIHIRVVSLVSLICALFWSVMGNYRLMSQELRIRTRPWAWLGFTIFLTIYCSGFIHINDAITQELSWFFASLLLMYLGALSEVQDPMNIKRLLVYIEQRNWRRFSEELPLWCASFALALLFVVPLLFVTLQDLDPIHIYPLALLAIALRDIGIFLYFSYGKNSQRAFTPMLLTLIILYGFLPSICRAVNLDVMVEFLYPLTTKNGLLAAFYSSIQAGIVSWLVYQRWQASV